MTNDNLGQKRRRREPLELQLTAMIDVFSMIVIFLIFGTVFGAADMVIPDGMRIPNSLSKEGIESAPRVAIEKGGVRLSLAEELLPISEFRTAEGKEKIRARYAPLVADYKKKKNETTATKTFAMNLVADRDAPYQDIFDVVATFREVGFNTILFVAMGQGVQK